jgi:deoxyribodipyrimidine photolyase-related protein
MPAVRIVLRDQLSKKLASLKNTDKKKDVVLMVENIADFTNVKHHKKKIAFILSSMRHFYAELIEEGYTVVYKALDESEPSGCLKTELLSLLGNKHFSKVYVTHPSEYHLLKEIQSWEQELSVPLIILEDDRFLCSLKEFQGWAKNKKTLRMEFFYREMRKKYNFLMQGDFPVGGQWNYDDQNRMSPKSDLKIPDPWQSQPDQITKNVLCFVEKTFSDHFGDLEPFNFAVTALDAQKALKLFIKERLVSFGDYQDAMIEGDPWMYHSHLSFYMNIGLLSPMDCIQAVENCYYTGQSPLNAVEGFIRQILGWREYVRGIYWLKMPKYKDLNFFNALRPLPDFYWTTQTKMSCLKNCLIETKKYSYAHHIQRLMVLGNFALLAGLSPEEVNEWYLIVYADAFEWVELPNVSGMGLFADGGILASKPYAAGGNYINKMSNYCKNCYYNVQEKTGPRACPFNYLYWNFLQQNQDKLKKNHRLSMIYKTYDRMPESKKKSIQESSHSFFEKLEHNELV